MVTWAKALKEHLRKDVAVAERPDIKEYTIGYSIDNQPIFYGDGRRIKKSLVPKELLAKWNIDQPPVETVDATVEPIGIVKPERPSYQCLFEGDKATRTRSANLQVVHLCEYHYFTATLGQIVIRMREVQDEPLLADQQA